MANQYDCVVQDRVQNRLESSVLYNFEERPRFSVGRSGQIKSRTSPKGRAATPSARIRSAVVVPWPIELKLGRCVTLMGSWPWRYFAKVAKEWFCRSVQLKRCVAGETYQTKVVDHP